MNFPLPKSLVANVSLPEVRVELFLKFEQSEGADKGISIVAKILDQAADLDPELQELLNRFGDYLHKQRERVG